MVMKTVTVPLPQAAEAKTNNWKRFFFEQSNKYYPAPL